MTRMTIVLALALAACSGGGTEPPAPAGDAATPDGATAADAPPPDGPACTADDLCSRTIDDCGTQITMDQCLQFYDPSTTLCSNIGGYTACNCDCLAQPTCDDYFACGQSCFDDWC